MDTSDIKIREFEDHICPDKTCYRGTIDSWGVQYKDGPCNRIDPPCAWDTKTHPTRKHYTDTPIKVKDDGFGKYWWIWTLEEN